jgi:hypothetical protein
MANHARIQAETALRARNLDRTLTTAVGVTAPAGEVAATGLEPLDACLLGGLPRGQLCELTGPRSSGRTALLLQLLAAATARGELAALVDPCDRLDAASAAAAGIDLDRLLWVRGHAADGSGPAACASLERAVERSLKALSLVLQAGGFGVVAWDVADVPAAALGRLPFTTWLRVQRAVEGRDTVCVLVAAEPLARSADGLTLTLAGRPRWEGRSVRRLDRMDVTARIVSPRRRVSGEVTVGVLAMCG